MPAPFHFPIVVSVCFFLGGGCAALNVQKPTAAVTGMAVRGVDADGFTLDFAVDVSNPNGFTLPLSDADYTLGVGGVEVLDGKASPNRSIPANGTLAVAVPVTVAFENLLKAETAIRDSGGNVPYDLAGGLSFDTGSPLAGKVRVPLRYSGTLPLRRILSDPEALLRNPAAKRLAASVLGRFFGR
jgi:LEA14-like dessication related protein